MFLKLATSVTALLLVIQCNAANYYFSANAGNDAYSATQAQSPATPWKTITKLNSYLSKINAGDSILFKRGETFVGSITIVKSGTAAKPIVIAGYGAGARPVITGFVPATNWVNMGGGIFQADCPLADATVNVVTLNGVPQQIGRYPNANTTNAGYLNVDSHVGKTQITSSQLNTSTNWAGGTVVIRKNHWAITTGNIVSNTSNSINYIETSSITASNNFGFFIQNHPKTLDQYGEWYYDAVHKKIQMYLGVTTPNNNSVSITGYDYFINMNGYNYYTIDGIAFTGYNLAAISIFASNGFQIKNCNVNSSGSSGILANLTTGFLVSNCSLLNTGDFGIVSRGATNTQILYDTLKNTGAVPGMGAPLEGSYEGIVAVGTNGLIANNIVINTGANGIDFGGDYSTVRNNYVDTFEVTKDDGGGIYTNNSGVDTLTYHYGMNILNNIVVNSVGAPAGSTGIFPGCASGIYLDDNSNGITITGNSVASCVTGLYFHNTRTVVATGNTFFNNLTQVLFSHNNPTYTIKNNTFNSNIVFSDYKTQPTLSFSSIANDIGRFCVFNSNYYSNTIDDIFPINANTNKLNLQLWQYTYSKDLNSFNTILLPCYTITIPSKKSRFGNSTFVKNINGAAAWSANGNLKAVWDNSGTLDGGSLKTYFTYISGSPGNNPTLLFSVGSVTAGVSYSLRFSMISNLNNRKLLIFIRNAVSPYNSVTEVKYLNLSNQRTENSIMITATSSIANAQIVFAFQSEDVTTWFDNLNLYTTNAVPVNPSSNVLFAFNATPKSTVVNLSSLYQDVKGTAYKGSTTLAPFTSIILIKSQDTLASLPPIVYVAPTTTDTPGYQITTTHKQQAAGISIYPNPATDHFTFNFNNDQNVKDMNIKVMNTNGDVILSQKVQVVDNSYKLNFNTKPSPGCYFIQLSGSGFSQTAKVIII